jgi:hypothetical protein
MSYSKEMNAGAFCFKLCVTCLILSPTLGIASAVMREPGLGSFALLLLAVAGVSFVAGLIIRIWE